MPLELTRIRHLVLDMDGTVYRGGTLLDSTLPFLDLLKRLKIGRTFMTNNSSRGVADYVDKLRRLGISASRSEICTSTDAVVEHLQTRFSAVRRLWLLGTAGMARDLESAGYVIDNESPEAVVVGYDTGLTYDRLCRAAWWIGRGLPFIASHPDRVCPTDKPTVLVDCGAITACLACATERQPVVLGKPDPRMLDAVCRRHHLDPSELAVVGDRLYTDIIMAQRAGAASVLVLTGEATADEAAAMETPPDLVLEDLGALGRLLAAACREKAIDR